LHNSEMNPHHLRCCKTKSVDTAGLGYELLPSENLPEGKEADPAQKQRIIAFFDDLDEPITETLDHAQFDHEAVGQGFIEMSKLPNGEPNGLYHLPGHTMRSHKTLTRFAQVRGRKIAWFKAAGHVGDVDSKTGKDNPEEGRVANEVMRIAAYSSRSDYYGIPEAITALGAIEGNLAQRDYNIAFFRNFGVPAYAVYCYGDYDLGDLVDSEGNVVPEGTAGGEYTFVRTVKRYFDDLAREPHSTLIMAIPSTEGTGGEVKVEIKPLAVDVKDASFTVYRKDNRDEIIVAHGVPGYRIGVNETGSLGGSTAEESTEIYRTSVINPRQARLEHLINKHVLRDGFGVTDWRFKLVEIDTSDEVADLDALLKLFTVGAASPNEVIRAVGKRFGLAEVTHPLMDAKWISGIPITEAEFEYDPQMIQAVKAMQEQLFIILKEEADTKRANRDAQKRAARDFEDARALLEHEVGG